MPQKSVFCATLRVDLRFELGDTHLEGDTATLKVATALDRVKELVLERHDLLSVGQAGQRLGGLLQVQQGGAVGMHGRGGSFRGKGFEIRGEESYFAARLRAARWVGRGFESAGQGTTIWP